MERMEDNFNFIPSNESFQNKISRGISLGRMDVTSCYFFMSKFFETYLAVESKLAETNQRPSCENATSVILEQWPSLNFLATWRVSISMRTMSKVSRTQASRLLSRCRVKKESSASSIT